MIVENPFKPQPSHKKLTEPKEIKLRSDMRAEAREAWNDTHKLHRDTAAKLRADIDAQRISKQKHDIHSFRASLQKPKSDASVNGTHVRSVTTFKKPTEIGIRS